MLAHLPCSDWYWVDGWLKGFWLEFCSGGKEDETSASMFVCVRIEEEGSLSPDNQGSEGLILCLQRAPFILVGCRLMRHVHLLDQVYLLVRGCFWSTLRIVKLLKHSNMSLLIVFFLNRSKLRGKSHSQNGCSQEMNYLERVASDPDFKWG
ncbi:hypothetical protein XENOCAPTIV_025654 [Xenoophorus captivus]|uniref:Uncharacterized protein n=1 Tax=Xenoophorus captivus TaxID=1517983 RepID=A0ABV0QWK8_9TELE